MSLCKFWVPFHEYYYHGREALEGNVHARSCDYVLYSTYCLALRRKVSHERFSMSCGFCREESQDEPEDAADSKDQDEEWSP